MGLYYRNYPGIDIIPTLKLHVAQDMFKLGVSAYNEQSLLGQGRSTIADAIANK